MVLVTGATGFLGSHLLVELLQHGEKIRALKRPGSKMDVIQRVFKAYQLDFTSAQNMIEWVEGDVLDIFSLEEAMEGVSEVYHCAALVSFDRNGWKKMIKVNGEGTANVINTALKTKIRKLCHVSSIAALGRGGTEGVINEDAHWKTSPQNSGYAVSKYAGEREVWRGVEEGLDAVIINPAIILGYGEIDSGTARFFNTVRKGLLIYPRGGNGFVYVYDVARAMYMLMKSDVKNERFVLSVDNLKYKRLLEIIAMNMNKRPPFIRAGRILTAIAWRFEWLRSRLAGNKPLITRESAQTSLNEYIYSGTRITLRFNFKYTSIEDGLAKTAELFRLYD